MKEYNRKTKRWEEPDKSGSLKKPETCKRGKPHDFVLLIPSYDNPRHHPFSKEVVQEYYRIEDERLDTNKNLDMLLGILGIQHRHWNGGVTRYYICSVCGKQKYEHNQLDN